MIYFTAAEVLITVAFFVVLGACFAFVHKAIFETATFLSALVHLFGDAFKMYLGIPYKDVIDKRSQKNKLSFVEQNIYEALMFLSFGISTIIGMYALLDGQFRIYPLIIIILSYCACGKTVGTIASGIIKRLLFYIQKILLILVYIAFLPVFFVFVQTKKIVSYVWIIISSKYLVRRSKRIVKIKLRNAKKVFSKI